MTFLSIIFFSFHQKAYGPTRSFFQISLISLTKHLLHLLPPFHIYLLTKKRLFRLYWYILFRLTLAKNIRCSLTVRLVNKRLCCGHKPKLFLISSIFSLMFRPFICILPEVTFNIPVNVLSILYN